jgi:hypothetical protein
MPTIDDTVGGADANSYEDVAYANAYHDSRYPALVPAWITSGDTPARALIHGTRLMEALFSGRKVYVAATSGVNAQPAMIVTMRKWKGEPATTTQRLAFPRIGLKDNNGNDIASDVMPWQLKDALAEYAGQLLRQDFTLDNSTAVKGITSVKAGSVAVTFKDDVAVSKPIPDAVLNLIPPSWFEDESIEYLQSATAAFDVL